MPSNEITAEQWDKLPSPSDFDQKAKKFRDERNNAWDEFLDISAQAGYNIENTVANRSLFMGGYESGKEAKESRLCLLLADIRTALGDPEGKMMQEDFVKHCKRLGEWVQDLKRAEWGMPVKLEHCWSQKFIANTYNDGVFGIFDMEVSTKEPVAKSVDGDRLEALTAYLKDKAA